MSFAKHPETSPCFDRRSSAHLESNDASEGTKLASALSRLNPEELSLLMVYGGDHPLAVVRRALPDVKSMSRKSLKACLISYIAYGWTGLIPETCRKMVVLVPVNIAPWLWGWPDRFLGRMGSVGSEVFTVGPYHGGEFSTGIDTREDLARLPPHYSGGVSTNEIETIARALKTEKQ